MLVVRPRYNASNLGLSRAVTRSNGGTIAMKCEAFGLSSNVEIEEAAEGDLKACSGYSRD